MVIDEGTNLLNQPGIGEPLRRAVQTARQYGIYVVLAGQSANARVIQTQTRDQFSTRLCFRTSPTSSRVVVDDIGGSNLHIKGRALVQMTGRDLVEVQAPWVSRDDFERAMQGRGPAETIPEHGSDTAALRVIELHRAGQSRRAIERAVFGYEGGAAHRQVAEILAGATATTATATAASRL